MKNISYAVKISLHPQYMRSALIGGQFCENEQFPFSRLCVQITETHHCPFCGKGTMLHLCDCEEFANKLAKLQHSVHDKSDKAKLHLHPYENLLSQSKATSACIEPLTSQEIGELGPDLWDDAEKVIDIKTNRSFYVVNPIYEEGTINFICKDLQSKTIYRCFITGYGYQNHKIYLGILYDEYVCRGDSSLIGNYSKEPRCKDLLVFDDWNAFCEKIKSI